MGNAFASTSDLDEIARSSESEQEYSENGETEEPNEPKEFEENEKETVKHSNPSEPLEPVEPNEPEELNTPIKSVVCEYSDSDSDESDSSDSSDSSNENNWPDRNKTNPHLTKLLIGYIKLDNVEKVKLLLPAVINPYNIGEIKDVLVEAASAEKCAATSVFKWVMNNTPLMVTREMLKHRELLHLIAPGHKVDEYFDELRDRIHDGTAISDNDVEDLRNIFYYSIYHTQHKLLKKVIKVVKTESLESKVFIKEIALDAMHYCDVHTEVVLHVLMTQTNTIGVNHLGADAHGAYLAYLDTLYQKAALSNSQLVLAPPDTTAASANTVTDSATDSLSNVSDPRLNNDLEKEIKDLKEKWQNQLDAIDKILGEYGDEIDHSCMVKLMVEMSRYGNKAEHEEMVKMLESNVGDELET